MDDLPVKNSPHFSWLHPWPTTNSRFKSTGV